MSHSLPIITYSVIIFILRTIVILLMLLLLVVDQYLPIKLLILLRNRV